MYGVNITEINKRFTYHPPFGNQVERYNKIREGARGLAIAMSVDCPDSRELSLALTKLEEAVFWANAAIARNENENTPSPDA